MTDKTELYEELQELNREIEQAEDTRTIKAIAKQMDMIQREIDAIEAQHYREEQQYQQQQFERSVL